ncbi:MAG: hypothetical protein KIT74_07920 [Fimbriimonadales bacterium]|nr:hypothetical protein [Fimbriimonadales bacterium]
MDAKEVLEKHIAAQGKMYGDDLKSMTHEQLATKPGDSHRCPYDFTFEVALLNRRVVHRLRGEDPGPWPGSDGFVSAPAEFCEREAAIREFEESIATLLAALKEFPTERMTDAIVLENGETSAEELCRIVAGHLAYHDGQLNLIQLMTGDTKVHWEFEG